jgi:hypothetical protein
VIRPPGKQGPEKGTTGQRGGSAPRADLGEICAGQMERLLGRQTCVKACQSVSNAGGSPPGPRGMARGVRGPYNASGGPSRDVRRPNAHPPYGLDGAPRA